jgi:hypothetical protein
VRGPPAPPILEVRLQWGSTVLEVKRFRAARPVTLGESLTFAGVAPFERVVSCDFAVPSGPLPGKVFPLVVPFEGGWALALHKSFTGTISQPGGHKTSLHEAVRSGALGPGPVRHTVLLPLAPGLVATVHHGELTFLVTLGGGVPAIPRQERPTSAWVNALIGCAAAHALAVLALLSVHTDRERERSVYRLVAPVAEFRAPATPPPGARDRLREIHAPPPGYEGRAGAERGSGQRASAGKPEHPREIARQTLSKLFDPQQRGRRAMFGAGGTQGELQAALGAIRPAVVGNAEGDAGLGTRGDARGGGLGLASLGPGALTRARSEPIPAPLAPMAERAIAKAEAELEDALDKESVGWVVEQQKAQLRYCYELALIRQPELQGRIALRWSIEPDGSVAGAEVEASTIGDRELLRCIVARVSRWTFPAPLGGGEVIVRYPVLLRPAAP